MDTLRMTVNLTSSQLSEPLHQQRILDATHHNPFEYLGTHAESSRGPWHVRVFLPHAEEVWVKIDQDWLAMTATPSPGLFVHTSATPVSQPAQLKVKPKGQTSSYETTDTYGFASTLSADELHLFAEGRLFEAYNTLGAVPMTVDGVAGVRFAVWAPNAGRVSVVGNFNLWDGRVHAMRVLGSSGVWELFIPHLTEQDLYKFEIRNREHGYVMLKADPYGKAFEVRPGTANRICQSQYVWQDDVWQQQRAQHDWLHAPFNCYEVHLGSWQRDAHGHFLSYRAMAMCIWGAGSVMRMAIF